MAGRARKEHLQGGRVQASGARFREGASLEQAAGGGAARGGGGDGVGGGAVQEDLDALGPQCRAEMDAQTQRQATDYRWVATFCVLLLSCSPPPPGCARLALRILWAEFFLLRSPLATQPAMVISVASGCGWVGGFMCVHSLPPPPPPAATIRARCGVQVELPAEDGVRTRCGAVVRRRLRQCHHPGTPPCTAPGCLTGSPRSALLHNALLQCCHSNMPARRRHMPHKKESMHA